MTHVSAAAIYIGLEYQEEQANGVTPTRASLEKVWVAIK
jgi:hypothetical protein